MFLTFCNDFAYGDASPDFAAAAFVGDVVVAAAAFAVAVVVAAVAVAVEEPDGGSEGDRDSMPPAELCFP
uniref:Uncharacterized protein n=1 Tax=Bracon brevicornis TaxID=1563983 RepID=A0A6V7I3M8_9HYME